MIKEIEIEITDDQAAWLESKGIDFQEYVIKLLDEEMTKRA